MALSPAAQAAPALAAPACTALLASASPFSRSIVCTLAPTSGLQGARGTLQAVKRLAYLMDATTARVVDFAAASAAAAEGGVAGGGAMALATVSHDARIDWLVSWGA